MFRKAFFGAFLFLSIFLSLVAAAPALAFVGGGTYGSDPRDSRAPRSEDDVTWYVRAVPVLLYNPGSLEITKGQGAWPLGLRLKDADLVWGELWTKPGWSKEETRFGLNQLYIPINPGMSPAPPSGSKEILVPAGGLDEYLEELSRWFHARPQVRVEEGGTVWASDASGALYISVPLPAREDFLAQAAGMNETLAGKWKAYLASDDPRADDGRIAAADGSTTYYRALDAYKHGATYYYHLLLNPGPQSGNWAVAAEITPYYDEPSPDGKGFYRGKDWAQQLEISPGMVPGFIGAVTPWANLKLEGPVEVAGAPGEEKEAQFTVTCEYSYPLNFNVGTMREGEQVYTKIREGLQVPAWDKVPVTLKFKIEDRPYKVRVGIITEDLVESDYKDNYVDVIVKPFPPDFYIKINPHQVKANPGQELTFTVTAGLKNTFPQPWKALVRAFHVVNGVEYPAPLTLGGVSIAPDQPVEFQPGEEKQGTVTVHAQGSNSTVVVKINPVDISEDADWSDNRDVAQIETQIDIAVTAWAFNPFVDIPWDGGTFRNGANIRVTRKDSGSDPIDVVVTVDGPAGRAAYTVTLSGGQTKSVGPYRFTVSYEGEYWVHVEAWPGSGDDAYPSDNVADVVVKARRLPPPETGPRDSDLHGELGS